MSRVTWGDPGSRFYETGVDRGVLYVGGVGVAWNGLTSISESPTGGEAKAFYMDGIKFLNIASSEEFEATLEAISSPAEFGPCDGRQAVNNGLFAHQQPRKAFSLSYRTLIGNDAVGQSYGYKIHLVYNALAAPASRAYATTGDSSDPTTKSWALTTLPPSLTGMKPTAHFVIDSRSTPKGLLKAIEDILYGSDAADPRMPLVSELIAMFKSEGPLMRTNLITNPGFRSTSTTVEARRNLVSNSSYLSTAASAEVRRNHCTNPNFEGNNTTGWANYVGAPTLAASTAAAYSGTYGMRVTVDGTQQIPRVSMTLTGYAVGEIFTMSVRTRVVTGTGWNAAATPYFVLRGGLTAGGEWTATSTVIGAADANGWRLVTITGTIAAGATGQLVVNIGWNNVSGMPPNTAQFDVDEVLIEKCNTALPYFDGSSATRHGLTFTWTGTANASASIASGVNVNGLSLKGYVRPAWVIAGGAADGTNSCLTYIGSSSTTTAVANPLLLFNYDGPVAAPGDTVVGRFRARLRNPPAAGLIISPKLFAYTSAGAGISTIVQAPNVTLPADGSWVDVLIPAGICPANTGQARLYVTAGAADLLSTAIIETSNVMVEKASVNFPWFDGNTPAAEGLTYSWTGTVGMSPAIATGNKPTNWTSTDAFWKVTDKGGMIFHPLSSTSTSTYFSALTIDPSVDTVMAATFEVPAWNQGPMTVFTQTRTYLADGTGILTVASDQYVLQPGESLRVTQLRTTESNAGQIRGYVVATGAGFCYVRDVFLGLGSDGSYFDGSTPDANKNFYSWAGAVDASVSYLNSWN